LLLSNYFFKIGFNSFSESFDITVDKRIPLPLACSIFKSDSAKTFGKLFLSYASTSTFNTSSIRALLSLSVLHLSNNLFGTLDFFYN